MSLSWAARTSLMVFALVAQPQTALAVAGQALSGGVLRAGPGHDFPPVVRLHQREAVEVHGCLDGGRWCDVSAGDARGWFPARNLIVSDADGHPLRVTDPAAALQGLAVLSFDLGSYWQDHYRGRPFFNEQKRWMRHGPRPPPELQGPPLRPADSPPSP